MTTAKLFKLGNSQAVRIPARMRLAASEVEIFRRDGDLVLRPITRSAGEVFARARQVAGNVSDWSRPSQGRGRPAPSLG